MPTVLITAPADEEYIEGTFVVRAEATDDLSIDRVELWINGTFVGSESVGPDTPTYEFSSRAIDTRGRYRDGPISVRVTAFDVAGQITHDTIMVNVDNQSAPRIYVQAPSFNASLAGNFRIQARGEDVSDVHSVTVFLDDRPVVTSTGTTPIVTLTTSTLAAPVEGEHYLRFEAVDGLGNRTTAATATVVPFRVDLSPPIPEVTSPDFSDVVINPVVFRGTATDPAGLDVRLFIDPDGINMEMFREEAGPDEVLMFERTLTLPEGRHTFAIVAVDGTLVDFERGNRETQRLNITVLDPEPDVQFVTPAASGDAVMGPTTLEVAVDSPVGDRIERVEFSVNGRAIQDDNPSDLMASFDFTTSTGTVAIAVQVTDFGGRTTTSTAYAAVVPAPRFRLAERLSETRPVNDFAVAYLDADNLPDVVVASSSLVVLTGTLTATGEWTTLPPVPLISTAVKQVRIDDVNSDGRPDLVLLTSLHLRTLINPGRRGAAWSFGGPPTTVNGTARFLVLADLDGRGDKDAVVSGGSVLAELFTGDGGQYLPERTLNAGETAASVVVSDIDDDGDNDLVFGRASLNNPRISVFRNGGAGLFFAASDSPTPHSPAHLAVQDIDGDGIVDIVAASRRPNMIQLMIGQPFSPGTFTASASYPTQASPSGLLIDDVTGNGRTEMLVAIDQAHGVELWRSGEQGLHRDVTYVMGRDFRTPRLFDLNGDGLRDLVGQSQDTVVFARRTADGFWAAESMAVDEQLGPLAASTETASAATVLAVAASGPPHGAHLSVWARASDGWAARRAHPLSDGFPTIASVALGDLDGDGRADAVVGSNGADRDPSAAVLFDVATSTSRPRLLRLQMPRHVVIGDVDNDGRVEAVVALGASSREALVLEEDEPGATLGASLVPQRVALGDIDADPLGWIDIAMIDQDQNVDVIRWTGRAFSAPLRYDFGEKVRDVYIGRLGRDARPDLVGLGASELRVLAGARTESLDQLDFQTVVQYPAGANARRLIAGDFNRDEVTDFVVINTDDRAAVLVGKPNGSFFGPRFFTTTEAPADAVVTDWNNDGFQDLVISHRGALMFITGATP